MLAVEGFSMEMRGISAAFFSSTTILNLATKHFSKYNLNIVNNAIISKIIVIQTDYIWLNMFNY